MTAGIFKEGKTGSSSVGSGSRGMREVTGGDGSRLAGLLCKNGVVRRVEVGTAGADVSL